MTPDEEKIYETDCLNDAIDNLEMLDTFLGSPVKWKWVFIAAHQAIYGFCICALSGTAPKLRVCDETSKGTKAMRLWDLGVSIEIIMEAFGESEKTVKEWISSPKLISLQTALTRVQSSKYLTWSNSIPLKLSAEEKTALERLTYGYRNEFAHFFPKTWTIYMEGIPSMLVHVMRIVKFISLESNMFFLYSDTDKIRIERTLQNINDKLCQMTTV